MAIKLNPVQGTKEVNTRKINLQMFADGDGSGVGGSPPARGSGGGYSAEYVQDLRNENASWRTKLRDVEKERDDYKTKLDAANQKVTDLEGQNKKLLESVCGALELDVSKIKSENAATEIPAKIKEAISTNSASVEKAQEALKKSAFIAAAANKGIRKEALEDAYKLADFKDVKVDLESMAVFPVDKDGKEIVGKDDKPVTGLDSLVETLVKEKSYLLGSGSSGVGSSSNPGGDGSGNLTPEEEGKKIAEERQKAKKEQASSGVDPWAAS